METGRRVIGYLWLLCISPTCFNNKAFFFPKARDDAHPVADLLCSLHSFWHCHHSGFQVREAQH